MNLGYENAEIIRADYQGVLALGARIDAQMPMSWSVAVVELLHALTQVQRGQWLPGVSATPIYVRWVGNVDGDLTVKLRMPNANCGMKADIGRLLEQARRTAIKHEQEEVATWKA